MLLKEKVTILEKKEKRQDGKNMKVQGEAYTGFARVYDLFMDTVPYEDWADYLSGLFAKEGIRDGLLLDLGCGTGKLTRLMQQKGYDMIGVDNAWEMLQIAREMEVDSPTSKTSILYLEQDMREFELYGTVRAIYSACDSINYLLQEEELLQVFRLVNNYLDPKGLFVFDCNTPFKYEVLLGEQTFAENRKEGSFIWENYYDEQSRINQYDLTLFIPRDDAGGLFEKYEETHFQRNYSRETIERLLKEAGLVLEAVYDAYTFQKPRKDSERLLFVARENGK